MQEVLGKRFSSKEDAMDYMKLFIKPEYLEDSYRCISKHLLYPSTTVMFPTEKAYKIRSV
jgi:hypothetical protein